MSTPQLPADVLAFITGRIDTVPELEALLMMSELADRHWSVEDVASRTYTSLPTARAVLERLQRRGLISADEQAQAYRFGPQDPADLALVARVASYYRANLVVVATIIHDKAPASVQEFARAFEFKKDH